MVLPLTCRTGVGIKTERRTEKKVPEHLILDELVSLMHSFEMKKKNAFMIFVIYLN